VVIERFRNRYNATPPEKYTKIVLKRERCYISGRCSWDCFD